MLAKKFPSREHESFYEHFPCEEICTIEDGEWCLAFDGSLLLKNVEQK